MLQIVDRSIEAFLRSEAGVAGTVEITCRRPDREWEAGLTAPTISLFMWHVQRDGKRASTGLDESRARREGSPQRSLQSVRIRCSYLVSTWAGELADEQALLGSVLLRCLGSREVPVADTNSAVERLELQLPQEPRNIGEVWQLIDGRFRVSMQLDVLATVSPGAFVDAGPPVGQVEIRSASRTGDSHRGTRASGVVEEL